MLILQSFIILITIVLNVLLFFKFIKENYIINLIV